MIKKKKLIKTFQRIFNIKVNSKIENLSNENFNKWDSLNHIRLINLIEQEFKIKLSGNQIWKLSSFKKIAKFLKINYN